MVEVSHNTQDLQDIEKELEKMIEEGREETDSLEDDWWYLTEVCMRYRNFCMLHGIRNN